MLFGLDSEVAVDFLRGSGGGAAVAPSASDGREPVLSGTKEKFNMKPDI